MATKRKFKVGDRVFTFTDVLEPKDDPARYKKVIFKEIHGGRFSVTDENGTRYGTLIWDDQKELIIRPMNQGETTMKREG